MNAANHNSRKRHPQSGHPRGHVDESAAERLLAQLGPQRGQLVRDAVTAIDRIDADEQQR